MNEVRDRARLVDASAFDGRGVTAIVPRANIEAVLSSPDGPPELVLDVERRAGDEVEAHTLRIEWEAKELEELLRTTSGDRVTLVLDSAELERALDDDVEAHGLREAAAVFAVAVTTAAAATAGVAKAGPTPSIVHDGGGAAGAPIVAVTKPAGPAGMTPQQIVDAVGQNAPSSGQVAQNNEASGGGFSISAPDPATAGIIAGGVALTIAAAAFTVRGRRPQTGHLA
jgi:hypothetical protein